MHAQPMACRLGMALLLHNTGSQDTNTGGDNNDEDDDGSLKT
jgi:hypothetical protein